MVVAVIKSQIFNTNDFALSLSVILTKTNKRDREFMHAKENQSKYASEKCVDQTGATSRAIVGNLSIDRRIDVAISIFHDQL